MKNKSVKSLTLIALMAAVICILGPFTITIPISPVPIAFANLAIYFTVMLLGWKKGTISCLIYLLIGLVGVPVFPHFPVAGQVFGPTGGYLIGYIFLALIGGYFVEKFTGKLAMYFVGMVLGTIVLYAFGTAWLAFQTGMTFGAALMAGVIPYIPGDLVKIILAVLVGNEVRKRLMAANLV